MATSKIEKLRQVGDDALTNLYKMVIPPVLGTTYGDSFTVRVESFEIPSFQHDTYEVNYMGQKILKTKSYDANEKEKTFVVRIDRDWTIYNAIKQWVFACYNPVDGTVGEGDVIGVPVVVFSVDSNDNPTGGKWVYENFRPKSLAGFTYENATGDPIKCNITGVYDNCY